MKVEYGLVPRSSLPFLREGEGRLKASRILALEPSLLTVDVACVACVRMRNEIK